jgi:chemotaxis protein CheD
MKEGNPAEFREISISPGEFRFGDCDTRLRTLLGSCVAITMWHPLKKLGGMCHFLLPSRTLDGKLGLDPRYGDEAFELMQKAAQKNHCLLQDFEFKIFGGSSLIPSKTSLSRIAVGLRNIEMARSLLEKASLKIVSEDVGGACARTVVLDIWNGDVWVRTTQASSTDPLIDQELSLSA